MELFQRDIELLFTSALLLSCYMSSDVHKESHEPFLLFLLYLRGSKAQLCRLRATTSQAETIVVLSISKATLEAYRRKHVNT